MTLKGVGAEDPVIGDATLQSLMTGLTATSAQNSTFYDQVLEVSRILSTDEANVGEDPSALWTASFKPSKPTLKDFCGGKTVFSPRSMETIPRRPTKGCEGF